MKILFISTKGPLPLNDGHSVRTFNLLKRMSALHEIHLLSFVKYQEEFYHQHELQKLCKSVIYLDVPANVSKRALAVSLFKNLFSGKPFVAEKYHVPAMRTAIQNILKQENFDLVHLDMLPLCCYLNELGTTPVLLNEHNVESALLARLVTHESNPVKRFYYKIQQQRLTGFEIRSTQQVDHVVACSEIDQTSLMRMAPDTAVTVVPNGVDGEVPDQFQQTREDDHALIFIGGFDWLPNRDALRWFDDEILPLIIRHSISVSLNLIGQGWQAMQWKNPAHINLHGRVEDIRPYLARSAVFVVPLRIGGGTRLKILDAMAMGKAVVSTTIGAEGLQVTNGTDICIADDAAAFASSVLRLMQDQAMRAKLKQAAQSLVTDRYLWDSSAELLDEAYWAALNTQVAGARS